MKIFEIQLQKGNVSQIGFEDECALSRLNSGGGFDPGAAEGREDVHDCDADMDFGSLPDFSACQTMSGSNQTESEPRLHSAALYSDQFVVR